MLSRSFSSSLPILVLAGDQNGKTFAECFGLFFAFVAATLWFLSARVKLPNYIRHIDEGFLDDSQPKPDDDLDRLTGGLTRQSRLSAWAAIAAGLSAVFQAFAALV